MNKEINIIELRDDAIKYKNELLNCVDYLAPILDEIVFYFNNNNEEKIKYFLQFGPDIHHIANNVYTHRYAVDCGYPDVIILNEYDWIDDISYENIEVVKEIGFLAPKEKEPNNTITIGKLPNGKYVHATNHSMGNSGGGGRLDMYGKKFDTEEECVEDALKYFKKLFEDAIERSKTDTCGNFKMPYCKHILESITSEIKPIQNLFTSLNNSIEDYKKQEDDNYTKFLKSKIVVAEKFGIETTEIELTEKLFSHQKDIVNFCLEGGRRAIFASFGLGKTFMQLEIAYQLIKKYNKPFLIVCPLGVAGEFKRDNRKLETGIYIDYITDTDILTEIKNQIYLTNYERIRKGDIDASLFCGVSFDEASILRNLQTETTNYVLHHFKKVPFRFVATATPTPNDYIEILNYADYLGVISRGHALTRFFQRDSKKAGQLKLYENKKEEFWKWVSTWACFINSPADLGYDDTGYNMPPINIIEHCIKYEIQEQPLNKWGEPIFFKDLSKSLVEVSREKRDSMTARINKAVELAEGIEGNTIIWHHLEAERVMLEQNLKGQNYVSVYGGIDNKTKEQMLIDFSESKHKYLLTKPKIAGSGCNFQEASHDMIFAGIDYKFNDFIQAIHRQYRFGQKEIVNVHIIYTDNEYEVMKTLKEKWAKHLELNKQMIKLVKENGLNTEIIKSQMERQIFKNGRKLIYDNVTLYNNDTIIIHDDKNEMKDNSVDLYLTSIPFGNHYEYSDNFNDLGHNHDNSKFFEQMDFLTPNMLRCLKPGRICAVHVKDRIRYSYQNGTSFTTIEDFSGQSVAHYTKHGFYLIGKITVTTDVVAENNQTYRLGWSEQCKDASKMGVGLPEYVLLFRKAPTTSENAYSDEPVTKSKDEYTKALWQLDAHSYQRSNGDRFLVKDELQGLDMKKIVGAWKKHNETEIYDFQEHLRVCKELDEMEKLSSTFMTLPVHSNTDMVWTDVNRMNTLNAKQVSSKKEKHICPLQFDIIERLINRYSNEGEVVCDPFGGLFSTAYKALEMNRKAISIELNSEYFNDGVYYVKAMLHKKTIPTLFDLLDVA